MHLSIYLQLSWSRPLQASYTLENLEKIICVEPKLPFREMNSNFQGFMDQWCGPPNFDKNLVNEKCFVQIPHSNQLNIAQQGQLLNLNGRTHLIINIKNWSGVIVTL